MDEVSLMKHTHRAQENEWKKERALLQQKNELQNMQIVELR
jgi:hypothetical protein